MTALRCLKCRSGVGLGDDGNSVGCGECGAVCQSSMARSEWFLQAERRAAAVRPRASPTSGSTSAARPRVGAELPRLLAPAHAEVLLDGTGARRRRGLRPALQLRGRGGRQVVAVDLGDVDRRRATQPATGGAHRPGRRGGACRSARRASTSSCRSACSTTCPTRNGPARPRALCQAGRPGARLPLLVAGAPLLHRRVLRGVSAAPRHRGCPTGPPCGSYRWPRLLFAASSLPYRALRRPSPARRIARALPLKAYADYPFGVLVNDQFDRFSAPIERRLRAPPGGDEDAGGGRAPGSGGASNAGWIGDGRVASLADVEGPQMRQGRQR